jgi:hypothetical protein
MPTNKFSGPKGPSRWLIRYAAIVKISDSYAILLDGAVLDYKFSYPADQVYVASDGTVRFAEVDVLRRTINWLEAKSH